MNWLAAAVIATGTLVLAGCKEERQPGVFDLGIEEVYRQLASNKLTDLVARRQCGILVHVQPVGYAGKQVNWRVTSSGQTVVEFFVALTPINDRQTKVEVRMPRASSGGEVYDGSQTYRRPAFNQPLRPAVEEQVAAILEGRAYDVKRVPVGRDTVCNVQRGGLESGTVFRVDDKPGTARR